VRFGCLVWGVHLTALHALVDRLSQQLYSFRKDGLYHNESNSVKIWIIVECISAVYLSNLTCFTLCHLLVQILYRAKSPRLQRPRTVVKRGGLGYVPPVEPVTDEPAWPRSSPLPTLFAEDAR
jgi:hypothetical protein